MMSIQAMPFHSLAYSQQPKCNSHKVHHCNNDMLTMHKFKPVYNIYIKQCEVGKRRRHSQSNYIIRRLDLLTSPNIKIPGITYTRQSQTDLELKSSAVTQCVYVPYHAQKLFKIIREVKRTKRLFVQLCSVPNRNPEYIVVFTVINVT